MVNAEIVAYIQKAKEQKMPEEQMRTDLLKSGWNDVEVQEAFDSFSNTKKPSLLPPVKHVAVVSHGMWDAFEHILLFISLYVMSSSIALILHVFVDKWLPGVLTNNYSGYGYFFSFAEDFFLRSYLASLIVALPLFIFFFLDITKRTMKDTSMRNIRARKILIYITLVIAFLIMFSHVIGVLYAFISGNVDLNIFLHLLVTLFVNGIIFIYYLLQIKQDRRLNA